jgi:hypothetical protein
VQFAQACSCMGIYLEIQLHVCKLHLCSMLQAAWQSVRQ